RKPMSASVRVKLGANIFLRIGLQLSNHLLSPRISRHASRGNTLLMSALPTAALTAAIDFAVDRLAAAPNGGYHPEGEAASEPIAWCAVSLANAGHNDSAKVAAEWLAQRQAADGSVGVTESHDAPYWPTALAMLAWRAVDAAAYAE